MGSRKLTEPLKYSVLLTKRVRTGGDVTSQRDCFVNIKEIRGEQTFPLIQFIINETVAMSPNWIKR